MNASAPASPSSSRPPVGRLAIVAGLRTPFCKAGGAMAGMSADDLAARVVRELMLRAGQDPARVDELVMGNVAQPVDAANVARVVALKAGMPEAMPAATVHRNCASGIEAVTTAAERIRCGEAQTVMCVAAESMSNIPLLYNRDATKMFTNLARAKTFAQRLKVWMGVRPRHFLAPVIGVQQGLTDPVSGMNMGQTAEVLAREFHATRADQDAYALMSHQRACAAAGRLAEEILPVALGPDYDAVASADDGPRAGQDLAALAKLKPYFDRLAGTVTVGNACPLTDGAVAALVMSEERARELGLEPLGYVGAWAYAGVDPRRMGIGPVHATARLLAQTGLTMADFDLVELNEAFAAQVIACERAFASDDYARAHLGREHALGAIDRARLNVNGGAIALGHPVGATGLRLIVTLLHELRRRGLRRGLATLCVGGGQGAAIVVESNLSHTEAPRLAA
jgi:acetyl-CoA C-acetyltransferase/acetyl-CoA acyltransferase